MARAGTTGGPWPVQLRYQSGHTGEEYVRILAKLK